MHCPAGLTQQAFHQMSHFTAVRKISGEEISVIVMISIILRNICGTSTLMHSGGTAQDGVVLYVDALSAYLYIFLSAVMLVSHWLKHMLWPSFHCTIYSRILFTLMHPRLQMRTEYTHRATLGVSASHIEQLDASGDRI